MVDVACCKENEVTTKNSVYDRLIEESNLFNPIDVVAKDGFEANVRDEYDDGISGS